MANPALNNELCEKFAQGQNALETMSVSGVVLKTFFMLAILFCTSMINFSLVGKGFVDRAYMLGTIGTFGGLIVAMVIIFSKKPGWLAPLSILYSGLEGLFIGGLSAVFAAQFSPSIIFTAVISTFAALFAMLFLYSARIIKYTEKFASTLLIAMLAVIVVYLVNFVVSFINPALTSALAGNGPMGIIFSAIVCIIAAANFIVDFHIIENGKQMGLSKDFEWYAGFSLMITLVWLYIEILNFLAKLSSRR